MREPVKKFFSKDGGDMKQQAFLLIISIVLLASCQREQDWEGAPDIKAKVESEQKTRTSLSVDESGAGTIYWNPSDQIDVFFGTKKAQYTSQNASDAIAATFKTSDSVSGSDVSSTNIWGLYPSNSSSSCNGSSITTTLPSTQYGVPNTFDKDIFPAVARSSSTDLQFYNVCGGIKFNLAYDDIKKITFRGNNNEDLAGTVSISFVDNLPKATIVNGVKEITLTPKTGTTFTKGADYYFVLLPGTLSAGFTITFTATDGTTGMLNYTDNPVTIKRSIFGKKGNMDVYAAFADDRQPNNVIYYTSADGQVVTPYKTDVFGANIVSNEYVSGRGIITFDGEVTSIGATAFSYCSGLTSIEIPNSVTSIGNLAFSGCRGLTSIEIPNSVTNIVVNPFAGCEGLSSIIVENDNPAYDSRNGCNAIINSATNELVSGCMNTIIPNSVTSIGKHAFNGCSGLTSIEIPNSVTSIDSDAFYGCSGLTSIEIPNSVTSIRTNPFEYCSGLSSIIVENDNPAYDSRNGCNAIINSTTNELISGCKNTIIPNSVTSIGDSAFSQIALTSIEIPNSVTSIGYEAFHNCIYLTSIEIPNSVRFISSRAFFSCFGLSSIKVYALTPPFLGTRAFELTANNCQIYVPAQSVDAYKTADVWSEYADRIQVILDTQEAVDLGLSVKWATCNVGADTPERYGDYYAWGETESKSNYADWSTYKWCNGTSETLTKYCDNSSYGYNGFTDNKTVLDLEDDAAHVNWGGSWRMPTDAEWTELRNNCTWTWTTQNGVNGYRVTSNKTGYTDKSIFLPAAGWLDTNPDGVGTYGTYCSSSLRKDKPSYALIVHFISDSVDRYGSNRSYGLSVRPVYGDFISVESISLNKSSLSITEGETSQLSATVMPANATEKTVTWTSSNTSVATVSSAGVVTAVSAGSATITAWASDGEHFATCTVTVTQPHEAVDLGLPSGLKWATCNVGASSPEEYGDYFAWGETEAKTDYSWSTYRWCNGSETTLTKYNTMSNYGTVDNKTVLDLSDDAARANWGVSWRMPTDAEWTELRTQCVWTWTTLGGKNGYNVRGPNGNTIFLPAAGLRSGTSLNRAGSSGYYWSSSLNTVNPHYALRVYFYSSFVDRDSYNRDYGQSVRPVSE